MPSARIVASIAIVSSLPALPAISVAQSVEYLANEGILITAGDASVLIDGLFGDGLPEYPVVPAAKRDSLEGAVGRFAEIDLVLVTHLHADHFDPAAVGRHLEANSTTVLVAPGDAIDALGEEIGGLDRYGDRLQSLALAPGEGARLDVGGIVVQALALAHAGIGHVAYLVQMPGLSVLHLGDTDPAPDLGPLLADREAPDVALLPFWVLTGPGGLGMARTIGAGCVAAFHLERDGGDTARRVARQVPSAAVLDEPGERLTAGCRGQEPAP